MTSSDLKNPNKIELVKDSGRSQIRSAMRQKRRAISAEQQLLAAKALAERILDDPDYQHAGKLAFYRAFDGEISPDIVLQSALSQGKRCFLPFMDQADESMRFVEFQTGAPLKQNIYGIQEPQPRTNNVLTTELLDLIFLPLVAFDITGTRLGMGKGYYDKHLAYLPDNKGKNTATSPKLVGLAHECQRVENLERAAWDIPMDKIITDQNTYRVTG